MNRKQKHSQRGSALALVLIFMTLMLVLGTSLIAASQYGVQQSVSLVKADNHYYAAESGAQLAAQVFLAKLEAVPDGEGYCLIEEDISSSVNIANYIENMKDQLLARVGGYYADTAAMIASQEFGGEKVELGPDFGITVDNISGDYDVAAGAYGETYTAIVYLDDPNFVITATSGGRTVTVETNVEVNASVTSTYTGLSPSNYTGVYYQGQSGGIYTDDPGGVKYNEYFAALNTLLSEASAKYSSHTTQASIIPSSVPLPARHAFNDADTGARYINTWSTVKLGKAGTTTEYPNLEYIRGENGLEIAGTVKLPKLKGIYITGGSVRITGAVDFPVLENVYTSNSPFTIAANAKINSHTNPTGECNFYGGDILYINCSSTVNWCRFYFKGVYINYGSGGKFTSNSIFYPRNELKLTGTSSSNVSGVIPQFYVPSFYINIGKDIGTFAAILMTTGEGWIVSDSHGFADNTLLVGLFVGKFASNSGLISNASVNEFHPEDLGLMMGESDSSEATTTVDFNYEFKDLNLRETTGEE